MIELHLDEENGIATLKPLDALQSTDFDALKERINAYIDEHGILRGLMIDSQAFPGWGDMQSMVRHLQFIQRHHQRVGRVAVVSDTIILNILQVIAELLVSSEVKFFAYDEREQAKAWLNEE